MDAVEKMTVQRPKRVRRTRELLLLELFGNMTRHASLLLSKRARRMRAPLKAVESSGIHVIENYWSKEKCRVAIERIETLLAQPGVVVERVDRGADNRIFGSDRLAPELDLFNDPFLTELMEELHRSKLVGFSMAAKLIALPNNKGSGGGWHRDSPIAGQYKAILYLSDVENENGPFEYVTRTGGLISLVRSYFNGTSRLNQNRFDTSEAPAIVRRNQPAVRTMTARAGTLLLVNTRGVHRGRPIKEGLRYAITNYYFYDAIPKEFQTLTNGLQDWERAAP